MELAPIAATATGGRFDLFGTIMAGYLLAERASHANGQAKNKLEMNRVVDYIEASLSATTRVGATLRP
ncbi:MAG: hypothetical protein IPN40_15680 [Uliginosibacterium sp.]|nr:hypothetical protein [Uliginosibacterium sp.]